MSDDFDCIPVHVAMMLRDNQYDISIKTHIEYITRYQPKINKLNISTVKQLKNVYYKIYKEPQPQLLEIAQSGYLKVVSPNLLGFIFDKGRVIGYNTLACDTLHLGRHEMNEFRVLLQDLYRKTGYVYGDWHPKNFGRWNNRVVIVDLDDVGEPIFPWKCQDKLFEDFVNGLR